MKKSLLLMFIVVVFCAVVGQGLLSERNTVWATDIGGPISVDTTFTETDSPYNVRLGISVKEGVTLTIEPGVVLEFASGIGMTIDGKLVARGTADKQIKFTGDDWTNITFTENGAETLYDSSLNFISGSIMEFCIVGKSSADAIVCDGRVPFISDSEIRRNAGTGIVVNSSLDDLGQAASIKITGNSIINNISDGISVGGGSLLASISGNIINNNGNNGITINDQFESVTIINNSININGIGGIVLGDGLQVSQIEINSNSIIGNRKKGINGRITPKSLKPVLIKNNIISGNNAGLWLDADSTFVGADGTFLIENNIIINNISSSQSTPIIKITSNSAVPPTIKVIGNEISGNKTFDETSGAISVRGKVVQFNENNIRDNIGLSFVNNAGLTIDATNNWWGTTDTFDIRVNILDFFTDSTRGEVNIDPITTEPFIIERNGIGVPNTEPTGGAPVPTPRPTPPVVIDKAPTADFTANQTLGIAPLEVAFRDQSTGFPTGWIWDFGDGIISSQQDPLHFYTVSGAYTVELKVSNAQGSDSVKKASFIEVVDASALKVDFTAEPLTGLVPLDVKFRDLSVGDPTSWLWEFGDGGVSENQNPDHEYLVGGFFSVQLTASREGSSSIEKKINFINVKDNSPVAEFRANATVGQAPFTVQFTDLSQPVGEIESWIWELGGGGSSTDQNPEHTYSNEGFFSVALTVSNSFGSDVERKTNLIVTKDVNAPVAEFKTSVTAGVAPLSVDFSDLSEPVGNIANWVWQFGDGVISEEQNPSHTYSSEGIFTASLTVSNSAGADTEVKPNIISVVGSSSRVLASFTSSSRGGIAPARVEFHNNSAGEVQEFLWDFGDGSSSTEENPQHTYRAAGEYNVMLTVKSASAEDTETREKFIRIVDEGGVVADFIATPVIGNEPLEVQFVDKSIGDANIWFWEFSDGSTSEEQNPKHTYFNSGRFDSTVFDVTLTAQNSKSGASDKMIKPEIVKVFADGAEPPEPGENPTPGTGGNPEPQPTPIGAPNEDGSPSADFGTNQNSGPAPLTVNFTDLSLNNPTEWLWDFGDGGASFQQNPSHTYAEVGIFSVTLNVENSFGKDSVTKPNLINVEPESADKSFTFKCRQHSLTLGNAGVFEKMNLSLGENEQCTVTLTNLEPGVPIEFSTYLKSGRNTSIQVSPANGVTDANGQMEFTISAIEKGTDWIAWAVRNDKGEFEFSKSAYNNGTAWGMFVEVK